MRLITENNPRQTFFSTPDDQANTDNLIWLMDPFMDKLD